jgi:hypothetical protein
MCPDPCLCLTEFERIKAEILLCGALGFSKKWECDMELAQRMENLEQIMLSLLECIAKNRPEGEAEFAREALTLPMWDECRRRRQ